jgi:hypothetical protein
MNINGMLKHAYESHFQTIIVEKASMAVRSLYTSSFSSERSVICEHKSVRIPITKFWQEKGKDYKEKN